jgi:hypothetical protein
LIRQQKVWRDRATQAAAWLVALLTVCGDVVFDALTGDTLERVKELALQYMREMHLTWPVAQASRMLKWCTKLLTTGNLYDALRSGRPPDTSNENIRAASLILRQNSLKATSVSELIQSLTQARETVPAINELLDLGKERTIWRRMMLLDDLLKFSIPDIVPKLTPENMLKRKEVCTYYLIHRLEPDFWGRIIWLDAFTFYHFIHEDVGRVIMDKSFEEPVEDDRKHLSGKGVTIKYHFFLLVNSIMDIVALVPALGTTRQTDDSYCGAEYRWTVRFQCFYKYPS